MNGKSGYDEMLEGVVGMGHAREFNADVATRSRMQEACPPVCSEPRRLFSGTGRRQNRHCWTRNFCPMSLVENNVATLPDDDGVTSGASGVDTGRVYAKTRVTNRDLPLSMWSTYGKSAGFRRNADIVSPAIKGCVSGRRIQGTDRRLRLA